MNDALSTPTSIGRAKPVYIVPLLVVALLFILVLASAWIVYLKVSSDTVDSTSRRFELFRELRASALADYFDTVRAEVRFWARDATVRQSVTDFSYAWEKLPEPEDELRRLYILENKHPPGEKRKLRDAGDGSSYSDLHRRFHRLASQFVEYRGYYDVFLFDTKGNLLYTVEKETDYATNMLTGPWKDSGLAQVYRDAMKADEDGSVTITDFESYGPSAGAPAAFVAQPVFFKGTGERLGVFALQLPVEEINAIMQFTAGMGESGETYVVGQDNLMRSDSRFSDSSTILKLAVETKTAKLALKDETGVEVVPDYRGIPVLSAYGPFKNGNYSWAVLAEIDEAELLAPARAARDRVLFSGLAALLIISIAVAAITLAATFARSRRKRLSGDAES